MCTIQEGSLRSLKKLPQLSVFPMGRETKQQIWGSCNAFIFKCPSQNMKALFFSKETENNLAFCRQPYSWWFDLSLGVENQVKLDWIDIEGDTFHFLLSMNSSTVHTKRRNQTDTGQINLLPNQRWGCTTVSVWTKMVTWERLTDKFHRNISSFQHSSTTPPQTGQTKKFQQSVQFSSPPAFISISEAAVRGRLSMPMIREFVEGVDTR